MSSSSRFWLLTLAAVVGVAFTLSLGRWQLSRAAQKMASQSSMLHNTAHAPMQGLSWIQSAPIEAIQFRRVELRGRWLADKTVYLDNRPMNGKVGLYVVTPFQLQADQLQPGGDAQGAHSGSVILVQRGWVARNFEDRNQVPALTTPDGLVMIEGRIAPPPGKLYELGTTSGGLIRQNLDLTVFKAETGLPLLDLALQQTGATSDGLLRDWPQANLGVQTHYGYAFQWFALSALIAILFVWFQIVKRFIILKRH